MARIKRGDYKEVTLPLAEVNNPPPLKKFLPCNGQEFLREGNEKLYDFLNSKVPHLCISETAFVTPLIHPVYIGDHRNPNSTNAVVIQKYIKR